MPLDVNHQPNTTADQVHLLMTTVLPDGSRLTSRMMFPVTPKNWTKSEKEISNTNPTSKFPTSQCDPAYLNNFNPWRPNRGSDLAQTRRVMDTGPLWVSRGVGHQGVGGWSFVSYWLVSWGLLSQFVIWGSGNVVANLSSLWSSSGRSWAHFVVGQGALSYLKGGTATWYEGVKLVCNGVWVSGARTQGFPAENHILTIYSMLFTSPVSVFFFLFYCCGGLVYNHFLLAINISKPCPCSIWYEPFLRNDGPFSFIFLHFLSREHVIYIQ